MSKLIAFAIANQEVLAGLGVVLLPSLITALGRKPGPYTNAGIAALQWLLDRLSFLTHSNSPGTLKFPLTGSGPASQAADPVNTPRSAGFARVSVLALLSLASTLLLAGCATAWTAAVKASPACYSISASNLEIVASEVYAAVTDVASANAIGAAEQIIANEHIDYETVLCVYQAVENQIANPHGGEAAYVPPDAGTGPEMALSRAVLMTPQQSTALERIHELQLRAQSGAVR